jgi:hypothetical protein
MSVRANPKSTIISTGLAALIGILILPVGCHAQISDTCMARNAVLVLQGYSMWDIMTVDNFFRLIPSAVGYGNEISYEMPVDAIVESLSSLGVLDDELSVDFDNELTKGYASMILVRNIIPGKGNLMERFFTTLFSSQEAYFRIATRQKLVPPGNAEDIITLRELAAIMLAVSLQTMLDPLPNANTMSIERFAGAIVQNVVSVEEAREILDIVQPEKIKAMLAL